MSSFRKFIENFIDIIIDSDILLKLLAPIAAITITLIVTKKNIKGFSLKEIQPIIIFTSIAIVITLFSIVKFLNDDKKRYKKYDDIGSDLKFEIDDLTFFERRRVEKDVEKIVNEQIYNQLSKNSDIKELEKGITQKISSSLEKEIISKLELKFNTNLEREQNLNSIKDILIPITRNTELYIDRIQRNSIVNLVIGIVGTIIAITILSFTILFDKSFGTIQEFLMHFLPRFTFIVFIQLFAFFFLRLYKNNLEDAKYFQNELSNLTAKSTSIRLAILTKNNDVLNDIIKTLSITERNFKLTKDETLQTIENRKIETEVDKDMITKLKEIIANFEIKK
jgi:hypothetical protein